VDLIARRFRGVLIALVVLGLSASAVFAGHVALQAAASAPTTAQQGDQDEQADDNDNESPDADNDDDANENGDEDGSGDAADNAGAFVSTAAQMATPTFDPTDPFKNHGEFVSCVAHMKDLVLPADVATVEDFLLALTPTICDGLAEDDDAPALSPDERDEVTVETELRNHGALVSMAAQMTTPVNTSTAPDAKQFANHGEFVSCVAKMKSLPEGFTGTPEAFLATVTPTMCADAAALRAADKAAKADKVHGKSGQHGKGRNRN
jgi:hypothetical protein